MEERKSTHYELGLGWAVKMKKKDFIGKAALEAEVGRGPEWDFVGIEIQWREREKHCRKAGLAPGRTSTAWRSSTPLYKGSEQVGYADRKSVGEGKSVDRGGRRVSEKKMKREE